MNKPHLLRAPSLHRMSDSGSCVNYIPLAGKHRMRLLTRRGKALHKPPPLDAYAPEPPPAPVVPTGAEGLAGTSVPAA